MNEITISYIVITAVLFIAGVFVTQLVRDVRQLTQQVMHLTKCVERLTAQMEVVLKDLAGIDERVRSIETK